MGNAELTLERLRPLTSDNFEHIKNDHFKPAFDIPGLKYFRDKARNERDLRELYRERALYELLQNADDSKATQACFILTTDGLAFAHDGSWFTVGNFINLADGWSDKDPNQCIGHKGLGFRSVLDMTPSPYLVKGDKSSFLGLKFSYALNYNCLQQGFKAKPQLKYEYDQWTPNGQRACPVMAIPGLAKKISLGSCSRVLESLVADNSGSNFTTLFWFPAKDGDIDATLKDLDPMPMLSDQSGRARLAIFVQDEATRVLPFLNSITRIAAFDQSTKLSETLVKDKLTKDGCGDSVLAVEVDGVREETRFSQIRKTYRIDEGIKKEPGMPKAVQLLEEAAIVLSVSLNTDKPRTLNDGNTIQRLRHSGSRRIER